MVSKKTVKEEVKDAQPAGGKSVSDLVGESTKSERVENQESISSEPAVTSEQSFDSAQDKPSVSETGDREPIAESTEPRTDSRQPMTDNRSSLSEGRPYFTSQEESRFSRPRGPNQACA